MSAPESDHLLPPRMIDYELELGRLSDRMSTGLPCAGDLVDKIGGALIRSRKFGP